LAGIAVTYLTTGRFEIAKHAPVVPVLAQEQALASGRIDVPVKTIETF
jgi:hypothetical protein